MTTDKENVTTDIEDSCENTVFRSIEFEDPFDYQKMYNRARTWDIEWAKKEDKRSRRIFMCKVVACALIGAILGSITYHKKK